MIDSGEFELFIITIPSCCSALRPRGDFCITFEISISVNSAGLVTRYTPAEILISAPCKNARYIRFFSADRGFFHDF
jgi:hypothetical protein